MVASGSRRLVVAATAALMMTCCFFTSSIPPFAMAQVTPTPVQEFAWVRTGPYLFIQGGYVDVKSVIEFTSSQTFILDLSVSWPVTAATWYPLSNGTIARSFYAVTSPNNQTVLTIKFLAPTSFTITDYNTVANTWAPTVAVTTVADILTYGLMPVADPTTGLVYIPGIASMDVYNIATQAWSSPGPIATSVLTARYFGAGVYNTARKTIMYVGGYNYAVNSTHFDPQVVVTEYSPSTNKWSVMTTTGTPPAPVANHCAAVSEDGSILIVFGGRTSVVTPAFTGALYILDVVTGVWTEGPAQTTPRIYAACVIVGDQMVVWGGSNDGNNTLPSVEPIVFDITSKQWVTSYTAPAYYLNNPPPKPPGATGGSGESSGGGSNDNSSGGSSKSSPASLGPIVGGVVGGLVVIGALAGFFLYRRRQNKKLDQVKEQVSQQRMVIEAERSNRIATHSNNKNGPNDGVAGGDDNSVTPASYPLPPSYSSKLVNGNTTTVYKFDQAPPSPHLNNKKQFTSAVSSPAMSSPVLGTPHNAGSSNYNSQNPQMYQKGQPMYQAGVAVSGPQEYLSPSGRAPQAFSNQSGGYHDQESERARQNHPQGEAIGYQ
ncbi:hypothetical protein EMPS_06243 [Entomortierella parvispora]|uniref:Uncharacterized protein n=1 Tax=Entomortierella parvispora TaxID=205924 RepID=A0A9P3LXJ1_9FUNG|nr:hypothetical protein EMPS_06243 [Entomortierella parvispora]